jgi:hypothetical protein
VKSELKVVAVVRGEREAGNTAPVNINFMVPLPQTDPSKGDSDEQLLAACRAEESKQRQGRGHHGGVMGQRSMSAHLSV